MVINRLGYDNTSTIGLTSKHGFMKLIFRANRYGTVSVDENREPQGRPRQVEAAR
jgi:hypothetical protein